MTERKIYIGVSGTRYTLQHHGILGMKWGIRRYQNPDGSYKPGAEGRYAPGGLKGSKKAPSGPSEDYVRSRSKSRQEMTDEELKNATQRLNNERQYEQYRKELDKEPIKKEKEKGNSNDSELAKKYKASELSNEELAKALDRLNKEKNYRQLVEEQKSPVRRKIEEAAKTFASTAFDAAFSSFKENAKDIISDAVSESLTGRKQRQKDLDLREIEIAKKQSEYASRLIQEQRKKMK